MSTKTILVVEDDPIQHQQITRILSGKYNVISATTGSDGIQKCIRDKPHLIVMDIVLPDMWGTEVARRIKNNVNTSHIPVIFCSSELCFQKENPNVAFIAKPYTSQTLLEFVAKFI